VIPDIHKTVIVTAASQGIGAGLVKAFLDRRYNVVATSGDVRDQPKVADPASELLQQIFGKDKNPCRMVYGVASLPLGTLVELEVIFEVAGRPG